MSFLTDEPIDLGPLLAGLARPSDGGLALFIGVVRDQNEGRAVTRLAYEAYGPMAEKEMARIADEIAARHPEACVVMQHRTGSLAIGDVAVVVAVAAPHREEAFAACREGIEMIKARVPVWKKEIGRDGAFWLEPCGMGHSHETD
jgi:molybdopterin synthase catalytic subunit